MRILAASLLGLLVASPLLAQEPEQQRQREHVVRTGDTLWDLAQHYFANPFRWRLIHEANTHTVADPHWIYPDQVIIIPGLRDGRPALVVQTVERPDRTVFYREPLTVVNGGPTILSEPQPLTVPVRAGEFNSAPFLLEPLQLEVLGQVIRAVRETRALGGLQPTAHPRDDIYIGYRSDYRPAVEERLMVVEVGERVREVGRRTRVIEPRAVVRVREVTNDVMVAQIVEQYGPVTGEHLVIPMAMYPDFLVAAAEPLDGPSDVWGRIIRFKNDKPLYGPTELAFIDRGRQHGVSEGDIFEVFIPGSRARSRRVTEFEGTLEQLPTEAVAVMRVIRVMDTTATVVVDEVMAVKLEHGLGVRRVRRMP